MVLYSSKTEPFLSTSSDMVCATEFVRYLHLIHYIGFVGAQSLNAVLVFLIITKSENLLGNYRYAMFVFTLCSMVYSMVEILVQPVGHMKGSMFVVFMHSSILNATNPLAEFLTCLHCVLSGFVASLLACQFIFRYLAVCRTHFLVHLQGINLCLLFIPSIFVFAVWHFGFFHGMPNTLEKQIFLREELQTCFNVNTTVNPFVGPMYWTKGADGQIHWNIFELISALSCFAVLIICFFTIVFCAYSIFMKMSNSIHHLSAKTLDLNKQLFRMLCIQTVIPMITMYFPVALFVTLPMFGKDIPYLGNMTSSSLAIYPIIEPIIAMTCVASFRKAIKGSIRCSVSRSTQFAIHPASSPRLTDQKQ
ncbi:Serpentine receptor class r-10 [Caenorhabditis elegans]|uniref:Serpentine receptor class r-10 n=1 Tax=Caenorhabditis elegans TaxID=6239 RepID=O01536_CAEEL|nr:Seven TM Receptor [Caenorhabditis elegans]CCD64753.4 Seven TM Receptor [Caenorhabditis elegans]|eukprot:NP_505138.4 Seven TM Receptor [Caenorhabditis elegans]